MYEKYECDMLTGNAFLTINQIATTATIREIYRRNITTILTKRSTIWSQNKLVRALSSHRNNLYNFFQKNLPWRIQHAHVG